MKSKEITKMLNNGLYIVATPIGNLEDISERAKNVLESADVIACEDTRISKKLFQLLGLKTTKQFICYEDHREESVSKNLVSLIKEGKTVALISDAGSPLISDPGYKLVKLCRQENIKVYSIPGACAVICALQLSGLPTNRFMFAGFIENKLKARTDLFNELKNINTTLVFYETAPRLLQTLETAKNIFENREMAVAREITKVYEECINGTAEELIEHFLQNPPKGEIVLMVAPPLCKENEIDVVQELKKRLKKMSLKDAAQEVALLSRRKKSEIYALGLKLKDE
ncbi:MAG: 16S rRNA (cytidine(1402)-2'-O)-methyltransferase [Alphaproteobacteria bacterium]|nr:16S rRNA (cytidine(1402)-2'-O)-methyltransferase [Alphaproteobacteria bacterium]